MRRNRVLVSILAVAVLFIAGCVTAKAACPPVPNQLANGQVADASQLMANFNQLSDCLNTGALTVPPVSSLAVTSPNGGTATIQNLTSTTPYNFNLPTNPGAAGQVLTSNGGSSPMSWTTVTGLSQPLVDGVPVVRPAASSFAWMNQGTATYSEYVNGPITLNVPSSSGNQIRGLEQAPPASPPYTLTAKLDLFMWGSGTIESGVYARDSVGKLSLFHVNTGGNPQRFQVEHWSSPTTISVNVFNMTYTASRTFWFRINNDGTNWTYSVSPNGADWMPLFAEPVAAYLGSTISALGVFANTANTNFPRSFTSIWSFELVSGSGTNSSWQSAAH